MMIGKESSVMKEGWTLRRPFCLSLITIITMTYQWPERETVEREESVDSDSQSFPALSQHESEWYSPSHLSHHPFVIHTVSLDYRIPHLIDGRTSKDIIVESRIVEAIDRSGRYRTLIHTGFIERGYGSIEYRLINWFQWTSSSRSTWGWPSSLRRSYGTWRRSIDEWRLR